MSPFPMQNPPENYTVVDMSDINQVIEKQVKALYEQEKMNMNLISKFKFMYKNTLLMANYTLQHPEMKKILISDQKFDLIILDMFLTDALLGLSTVFDCPVIALSACGPHSWVKDVFDLTRFSSHVPHLHSEFKIRQNLGRRMENAFFYFLETIFSSFFHLPSQEELFNQVFPNTNKTFDEVRRTSVAITLVNSDYSISFPKPFLPNTIEIAGMQVNEAEPKPLPDDIREFIENSEHGVIYFSLGSNVKASRIDDEKKNDLIKALSSLKQNTIWRNDDDSLNVNPKKIMVRKWLPQNGILSHNNTKLFITHAALVSVNEAIYFAKPIVAVPIFGDQPKNAKKLSKEKFGIHLDYFNLTESSLKWAVNEVLSGSM